MEGQKKEHLKKKNNKIVYAAYHCVDYEGRELRGIFSTVGKAVDFIIVDIPNYASAEVDTIMLDNPNFESVNVYYKRG